MSSYNIFEKPFKVYGGISCMMGFWVSIPCLWLGGSIGMGYWVEIFLL